MEQIQELTNKINQLTADIQTKHDEMLKGRVNLSDFKTYEEKVDGRMKQIEDEILKLKTPARGVETKDGKQPSLHKLAFEKYARKGVVTPEEMKVMTISDDTTGGYLATPPEYVEGIIRTITEMSPIRQLAWVKPTTARSIAARKRTATFAASRTAEIATRTETTGLKYGKEEMALPEAYALVKVSWQDLEDSAFNLEAEIRAEASEQFSVLEGKEFITGSGTDEAEGFLTNPTVIAAAVSTAGSTVITADDLINLQYTLKEGYTRNATWVMKRVTVKTVRILKEATTNAYIWQPGLQFGQPPSLLGNPIVECVDMPSGLVGNQYEVAYGDFRRGYLIGDRIQIEMQRLAELYAGSGQVGFLFRKRFNGQVVLPEAIKVLKIKA